jgi:hypothetical protein
LAAQVERLLFDTYATEHSATISGTEILYFVRDMERSKRDPLYDEPVHIVWIGPYKLKGSFDKPEPIRETIEQGQRAEWDAIITFPRSIVEAAGMRVPLVGDVVQVWDIPFFNEEGVDHAPVPGRKFAFDVENVDSDGHVNNEAAFVNFRLTVKRRTEFTPERRIAP